MIRKLRESSSINSVIRGKVCYVVVELDKSKAPVIIGVFYDKQDAEEVAYNTDAKWRNIIKSYIS